MESLDKKLRRNEEEFLLASSLWPSTNDYRPTTMNEEEFLLPSSLWPSTNDYRPTTMGAGAPS